MTSPFERLKAALAGRYVLECELGAGGMATVYLAEDVKHRRKVAVKVLRPELAAVLGADRFLHEIEVTASLQHPHILPLFDSGEADGFLYYVMPHVEGESLRNRLTREGSLPIADAVRIIREVVDALASAHRQGVVHRDIKPDNVMLSQNHALVTDFGVAKAVSEATGREALTTAGMALGTPAYMAPEQASADPNIDHRADIYAVGILAYELLAGQPPFTGTTPHIVLTAHVSSPPEPVTAHRAAVPPVLASLVMRCLEKNRADRWQTADELLPQLEALSTPSGGVTPTATVPVAGVRARRRRTIGWIAAGVVGLGTIGGFAFTSLTGAGANDDGLVDDLVLVTVFENQTGDVSLDHVGKVLADWLAREIEVSGLAEVVDPQTALAGRPGLVIATRPNIDVAREVGAATMVAGTYFTRRDSIQIQANLVETRSGRLLTGLDPVTAAAADPLAAGPTISDRVLGGIAAELQEIPSWAGQLTRAPRSYQAYKEFVAGLEFRGSANGADRLPHFERALGLDSTFYPAAIYMAISYASMPGGLPRLDTLVAWLRPQRDQLKQFERYWLDHYDAYLAGDLAGSYRAHKDLAALRPSDPSSGYWVGQYALRTNRLREAVDVMSRMTVPNFSTRYWFNLTAALHLLGEHDKELFEAQRGREELPDSRQLLDFQVNALIGLGRVGEVRGLINQIMTFPSGSPGPSLTVAALELRAHGFAQDARDFQDRAVAWFQARLEADPDNTELRHRLGHVLYDRGSWEETASLFTDLDAENPDNPEFLGMKALALARAGRLAEAEQIDRELADLDGRYLRGQHTRFRGFLAAVLGYRERAVDLLIQAHQQGVNYGPWIHRATSLDSLRGYPRFEEFARPRD